MSRVIVFGKGNCNCEAILNEIPHGNTPRRRHSSTFAIYNASVCFRENFLFFSGGGGCIQTIVSCVHIAFGSGV